MKAKIIVNQQIYLDQLLIRDLPVLQQNINNYEIYKNTLNIPYPYTTQDAEFWFNQTNKLNKKYGVNTNWVIRNKEGELIGGIGNMLKYGVDAHKDEIGYWLAKPYWGKGIMTEVVKKYVTYLFKTTSIIRIEATIFARNKASEQVLLKSGFGLEGNLRKSYLKDGEYLDGKLYTIIR